MRKCFILLMILTLGVNVFAINTNLKMQGVLRKSIKSCDYTKCSLDPIPFSAFSEDFEGGSVGWEAGFVGNLVPTTWHTDTFQAYGGSGKSWWMGGTPSIKGYDNLWYQVLTSPKIVLPATGLTFTFKMNRHVEGTAGAEAPYNGWDGCNVRISSDNGDTWTVLTNPTPAYNSTSMYSFGLAHGEGANIPGWGGSSNGWVDASFDISAYANDTVMISWVFASDPGLCTVDSVGLFGWQVDSINVANVFTNDGEDTTGFSYGSGAHLIDDRWALTDSFYHSPTHSYHCIQDSNTNHALLSPSISIPDTGQSFLSYYVWCDMPDYDGSGGDTLEDYYWIDVSTDGGILWNGFAYDYAANGSDSGWVKRDTGLIQGNTKALDLSQYAGQTIRLRWVVFTDNNDDGGKGTGLYIDDINIDTLGIEESNKPTISTYSLSNCLPNPFTRNTEIKYFVPTNSFITVKIFNLSGQEVTSLVNKEQNSGSYAINWNGKDKNGKLLPTGMYLYQLKSGSFSETKKMVLMK
ncbi:MAG: T9SS type A sorting domain-containing protein [bacterium]|nr:T9SS type A sorting domain-containing protein [bacterium]